MSLWEKCGVDIVLLAVSFGFLYFYTTNITNSIAEGTVEATGELDPLLFIFSTLMILGFGLLFIRCLLYTSRGYYVDTVGKNKKAIEEYIRNQLTEDIANDQITLKEYIDPFTGCLLYTSRCV